MVKCSMCPEKFDSMLRLDKHMKTHQTKQKKGEKSVNTNSSIYSM